MSDTVREREDTHGPFEDCASHAQSLKNVIRNTPKYGSLSAAHRQALDCIADKMGRILAGNADFPDHWEDISGYGLLGKAHCDGQHEFLFAGTAGARPASLELDEDAFLGRTEGAAPPGPPTAKELLKREVREYLDSGKVMHAEVRDVLKRFKAINVESLNAEDVGDFANAVRAFARR